MSMCLDVSLSVIVERLLRAADADLELASALRCVAESVLNRLDRQGYAESMNSTETCPSVDECTSGVATAEEQETTPVTEPLPLLHMQVGFKEARSPVWSTDYVGGEGAETGVTVSAPETGTTATVERLREIAEQLAMKANACRWGLDHVDAPRTEAPSDFYARSSEREWHPWMLTRFRPEVSEAPNWLRLEQMFLAAAVASENLSALMDTDSLRERFAERGLSLAQQVTSALANAVVGVGQGYDCSQLALAAWLKAAQQTIPWLAQRGVSAYESDVQDVVEAANELSQEIQAARQFSKEQRQLFNKARYHARKIGQGDSDPATVLADWRSIASALDGLVRRCGVRPSSVDLRNLLLPIHDRLPMLDEVPSGFDLCLRALDEYLTLVPARLRVSDPVPDAPCVAEARRLLEGSRVALIGGDMRPEAKRRLEEALGLKELIWVRSKVHASVESFRPAIVRPDVNLALLAIRWSSHSYVEVRDFCEASGKPLVWLAGGYNPNQVAHQIMQQASDRLAAIQQAQRGLLHAV